MPSSYSLADVYNWHALIPNFQQPVASSKHDLLWVCSNTAWSSLPVCCRSSHQHGDNGSYEAAGPSAAARQLGTELSCNL